MLMNKISEGVSQLTDISIKVMSLAIILQIVFGHSVGFLGGNVVGILMSVIYQIGEAGIVGLVTLILLWKLFEKNLK